MRTVNKPSARMRRNIVGFALFVCFLLFLPACGSSNDSEKLGTPEADAVSSLPATSIPAVTSPIAASAELQLVPSVIPTDEIDIEDLRNTAYHGILDEAVLLDDGTYEGEPFVSGGASRPVVMLLPEPIAFGDLNGDDRADAAVILVSESGGSGSFVYLAAVESRDGVATNVATSLLGDRVQVQSLDVVGDRLVAELLSHAADDPACCPSLETTRTFLLRDGLLVDEATE